MVAVQVRAVKLFAMANALALKRIQSEFLNLHFKKN